jgi:hypothetical protein
VFTDESYVHQQHSSTLSFYLRDPAHRLYRRSGKGVRLIIVHALTREGLVEITIPISEQQFTAEWLFWANSGKRDYHTNMNGTLALFNMTLTV